jgi:hypothetical protein
MGQQVHQQRLSSVQLVPFSNSRAFGTAHHTAPVPITVRLATRVSTLINGPSPPVLVSLNATGEDTDAVSCCLRVPRASSSQGAACLAGDTNEAQLRCSGLSARPHRGRFAGTTRKLNMLKKGNPCSLREGLALSPQRQTCASSEAIPGNRDGALKIHHAVGQWFEPRQPNS